MNAVLEPVRLALLADAEAECAIIVDAARARADERVAVAEREVEHEVAEARRRAEAATRARAARQLDLALEQARRAEQCLAWMRQHVDLLRRLQSGRAPIALDLFCGGGGRSEGVRRMGGVAFGVDIEDQPEYRARFGDAPSGAASAIGCARGRSG